MAKIITPVVTILNENEKPDYEGNKKVIDYLINGAIQTTKVMHFDDPQIQTPTAKIKFRS